MDAALKEKWVKALRSGEFKQGRKALRTEDGGYCCLGVLCVVAGIPISPDGHRVDTSPDDGHNYDGIYKLIHGDNFEEKDYGRFVGMNDFGNLSFDKIADYIEAEI